MRAILLCAGFATRLQPLTLTTAKPLLPVDGVPVVEHLLDSLCEGPVDAVTMVVNTRFRDDFVGWHAGLGERYRRLRIDVLDNGVSSASERRGAIGDLLFALRRTEGDDPIVVAAGDNLFQIDFGLLWDDVARSPGSVILVYRESDPSRLRRTGVAEMDDTGRVIRLVEKPASPSSEWACPALYVLSREAQELVEVYVDETGRTDNLGEYIGWLAERAPVFGHRMSGERWDIGDRESYDHAETWLKAMRRDRADA